MIKAIVFDFDGTIADTIPAIREGVNATMRLHGYPEHSIEAVLSFINMGARSLIQSAMPAHLREDEGLVDTVLRDYHRCYGAVYHHTETAYEGMAEMIQRLRKDYRIGVLSNKQDEFVKKLTAQVLLPASWDAAQGVVEGHPTKPHPYLSERIAAELGVSPSECILVGDSDIDILTAKNAGMTHIGVTWGFRSESFLREHGARLLAHTPEELEKMIRSIV